MPDSTFWSSVVSSALTYSTTFIGNFSPLFAVLAGVALFGLILAMLVQLVKKD
jgi:hypothetical protein